MGDRCVTDTTASRFLENDADGICELIVYNVERKSTSHQTFKEKNAHVLVSHSNPKTVMNWRWPRSNTTRESQAQRLKALFKHMFKRLDVFK